MAATYEQMQAMHTLLEADNARECVDALLNQYVKESFDNAQYLLGKCQKLSEIAFMHCDVARRRNNEAARRRERAMPEHVLSLSYGKDSLACLGAIEQLGWPLDRIVHAEVWATDTIPADLPPMVEFKTRADEIIKQRWGIEVEHVRSKYTYQDCFYMICGNNGRVAKSKCAGSIYGWPFQRGPWCNSRLKQHVLEKLPKDAIQYVGIAADEPSRFHVLSDKKRSPLVAAKWSQPDCHRWCAEDGLLSPTYTSSARGGCWFCHNQGVNQLRILRHNYPELWALMLKWDTDSPVTFKADGHTVHDYDRRFALEDAGLLSPDDKVFRWSMLDDELNYRMEEFR